MEIDYAPEFKRTIKKLSRHYRSIRDDLEPLITSLKMGELLGDPLQNISYSAFKVRIKNSDNKKGKSGGYRVIYYLKTPEKTVLLTIYSKSHQSDVDDGEVRRIIDKYEDA
jgi:mRNA-degrading endonuclease RelE of RelBE toxin-antitoxin system